jgi:hypothetical protein
MRVLAAALLISCAPPRPATIDASVVFAPKLSGEAVDGHVRCAMARANEITCRISHEGSATLEVCFHAEVKCANGNSATAEACRPTPQGAEIVTVHAADGCDAMREGRVSDAWIIDR